MDLIGSIKLIENRLGWRKPDRSKGKPAQKNTSNDAVDDKNTQADAHHPSTENNTRLGLKVDTTA